MKHLYHQFGKANLGYTQDNITHLLQALSSYDFKPFFNRFVFQANGYEAGIAEALEEIALEMYLSPPKSAFVGVTGIRYIVVNQEFVVHSLADGGPGYMAGLCEDDVLLQLNQQVFSKELAEEFFEREEILEAVITVRRNERTLIFTLPMTQRTFYPKVRLRKTNTENKRLLKNRELFGI